MVDVETGFPSETMRPLDAERHTPAGQAAATRALNPRDREAASAGARGRRQASRSGRPPALRRQAPPQPWRTRRPPRWYSRSPATRGGDALVDTGELLWLEDSPRVASMSAG